MLKQTKVSEKPGSFLSFCLYCGLGTAISLRKIHQNSRQLNLFDFSFEIVVVFGSKTQKFEPKHKKNIVYLQGKTKKIYSKNAGHTIL